jgi:hypothetical protein
VTVINFNLMEGKDNDDSVTGDHKGNYLPKIKSSIVNLQSDNSKHQDAF